jgi:SM-20-related protein
LKQLSKFVYCEDFLDELVLVNNSVPNMQNDYPYMIIKDFLPKEIIKLIQDRVYEKSDAVVAEINNLVQSTTVESTIKDSIRKTNMYALDDDLLDIYEEAFLEHKPSIEEYFSIRLTQYSQLQVLEYLKGFFYKNHSDDSNGLADNDGNPIAFIPVAPQRKITTILFGSDHSDTPKAPESFSGGEILFNYLSDKDGNTIEYKPVAGDMLVFPSNPYFSHEVKMVEDGYRLTLVQWHDGRILQ